jgi:hypothetical protein
LNLRSRLTRALLVEPPDTVSRAQERILEQRFFDSPRTPAPADVIELSASRLRPRF